MCLSVSWEPESVSDWTVNSCRSRNETSDSSIMDFQWPQLGQLKLYAGDNYVFYWWGRNEGLGNDMWQLYKPLQPLCTSKGRENRQWLSLRSDLHSDSWCFAPVYWPNGVTWIDKCLLSTNLLRILLISFILVPKYRILCVLTVREY